jgi:hypothetical protein
MTKPNADIIEENRGSIPKIINTNGKIKRS